MTTIKMTIVGGHHDGQTRYVNHADKTIRLTEFTPQAVDERGAFSGHIKYHIYIVDKLYCEGTLFYYLRCESISPQDSIRMLLDNYHPIKKSTEHG